LILRSMQVFTDRHTVTESCPGVVRFRAPLHRETEKKLEDILKKDYLGRSKYRWREIEVGEKCPKCWLAGFFEETLVGVAEHTGWCC
jgi:hypothetical protein